MSIENTDDFDKLSYVANSENVAPAGSHEVRWNNASQISASHIYISVLTSTPENPEVELSEFFEVGNHLVIANQIGEESFQRWLVKNFTLISEGKYFDLEVTLIEANGFARENFDHASPLLVHIEEIETESHEATDSSILIATDGQHNQEISSSETVEFIEPEVEESTVSEVPKKSLDQLIREKDELEKKRSEMDEEIARWELSAQQLASWHDRHSRSFLWKTLDLMQRNLKDASNKIEKYNEIVDGLTIPNPGQMIELRKSFHKKLLTIVSTLTGVCLLLLLLPKLTGLALVNKYLSKYFVFVSNPVRTVVLYSLLTLFFLVFGALIAYYRGWAGFERKVRTTLWELQSVAKGVDHVRNEEIRLKGLYPQVKEWLEILGNALTNPWKIREEWFESDNRSLKSESLPYSLKLATPLEEDTAADIAMQREAVERFMVRGWRAKVFEDQVDVIRQTVGMSEDRLNVEQIDKDISFSPNGPRAIVYRYINDNDVLEKVGRRQLLPLIIEVQKNSISQSRPPVSEVRQSQFSSTKKNDRDLTEEKKLEWDEFLSISLPLRDKPRTPLSVLGLSDEGRMKNYQDNYETFLMLPSRLQHHVEHLDSAKVKTYEESTQLPMDITVRADFSGPISREHLLFLAKSREELERDRSLVETQLKESLKNRKSGIN